MNIWWFSQYASTPNQQFTTQHDMARRLVDKGHRVTFFASGFSHYLFKEIRLQPGEHWRAEMCQGVCFVWIRTPPYDSNNWRRLANICSYALRAYRIARNRDEKADLVVGTTFHPLAALCAYAVSVSKRVPFIFEVKDLWPLTMIEFGRLRPRSPAALTLGALEKFLAKRATKIVTTLPGVADYFHRIGVSREKTTWVPNGIDLSRYKSLKPYSGVVSNPPVLLYAGGLVSANALETVLLSAEILQRGGSDAKFIFVGGGQDKPRLLELAKELKLKNAEFRNAVPKNELYRVMEEADAFILSMRDLPRLYRYGMSFNKLCDYAACGRPILFAGSPSHNVVEEFNCGLVVPPENPAAFADAVNRFVSMSPEQRREMGRNGIRCAKERFDIAILANQFEQMLLSVADRWGNAGKDASSRRDARSPEIVEGFTEAAQR